MNRQTRVCLLSFCLAPGFWLLLGLGQLETQYCHFPQQLLTSLQQVRLDSLRTEQQYLAALRTTDAITFKDEFETEFLLLLDAQQAQAYDSLTTLDGRKAYIENYWKASNPNPLLPENDWLLDILKRRAYARENFPAPESPYFDDRGKYYLKYGKPRFRCQDPGGLRYISFFQDGKVYSIVQKFYPLWLAPDKVYATQANETWDYHNVMRDFVIHFIKEGTIFRAIKSLKEVILTKQRRNVSWQYNDLIQQRAATSPALGSVRAKLAEFETNFIAIAYGASPDLLLADIQNPEERIFEMARKHEAEVSRAFANAPVTAHDPIHAINKLQFTHDLAQFRGPKGATRLEIALLSPLHKNLLKKFSRDSADTLQLSYRCLLRDQQFEPVAEDAMMSEFQAKWAAAAKFPNAVGKLTVTAQPGENELTLQIKNVRQDKIGFTRQMLGIRDFRGDALMISDIQFLTEAASANHRQILPVFTKLNTAVAPYPFEKIHQTIPLLCYFEIYNLKSAGIIDNFEVVYKVISEKSGDKKIAVSVSYTRPVTDDTAPELIGVDLRKVPKGAHRLEVTVTAMNVRRITASVQKEIVIAD